MTGLLPLLFLWLVSRPSTAAAAAKKSSPPRWPTPTSPPPIPAFQGMPSAPPTPSADPSQSSTPLATLHTAPPKLAPASSTMPGVLKAAAKRKAASAVTSALARFNPFGGGSTPTTTATVSTLQKILTDRGVRVARDGLYGPKTAGAWKALAQSKGLPTTISREGPKVAKVATQAIETLAVPPIP